MDNTVSSDMLAEAKVEITGTGVIADKQSPGFFARVLDWLWPF
jgi:flagellar L-ring protein precursor FlgH